MLKSEIIWGVYNKSLLASRSAIKRTASASWLDLVTKPGLFTLQNQRELAPGPAERHVDRRARLRRGEQGGRRRPAWQRKLLLVALEHGRGGHRAYAGLIDYGPLRRDIRHRRRCAGE